MAIPAMISRASFLRTLGIVLSLTVAGALSAVAEDLKLTDGTVYRKVRILEVRPDALVIAHRNGVALAEYEMLPKSVRKRFGFDPRKANEYREREATARVTQVEENNRLTAEYEKRKLALVRARVASDEAGESNFSGFDQSQLTYRPGAADRAEEQGVTYLAEDIERIKKARDEEAREASSFWNSRFWKNPVMTFIGSLLGAGQGGNVQGGGFNSEPRGWH